MRGIGAAPLSIIIPTLNEAASLGRTLANVRALDPPALEVLVVDGGSCDATRAIATAAGVAFISCESAGRAIQLNAGPRQPALLSACRHPRSHRSGGDRGAGAGGPGHRRGGLRVADEWRRHHPLGDFGPESAQDPSGAIAVSPTSVLAWTASAVRRSGDDLSAANLLGGGWLQRSSADPGGWRSLPAAAEAGTHPADQPGGDQFRPAGAALGRRQGRCDLSLNRRALGSGHATIAPQALLRGHPL